MNKNIVIFTSAAFILGAAMGSAIGAAGKGDASTVTASPVPAVTVTVPGPAVTVTVPGPTITVTVKVPGPVKTVTVTKEVPAPALDPAPSGSSCDAAREAILTGSTSSIKAAMSALVADKSANSVAREYARYYLGRDAGSTATREMDIGIIQMYCTL